MSSSECLKASALAALHDTIRARLSQGELQALAWVLAYAISRGLQAHEIFDVLVMLEPRFAEIPKQLAERQQERHGNVIAVNFRTKEATTVAVERCSSCNASLGTLTQDVLPGSDVQKLCIGCQTNQRAKWMLEALPDEDDREWADLSDWEQSFVSSVRGQFERKGQVSEKQFLCLEKIYDKHQ